MKTAFASILSLMVLSSCLQFEEITTIQTLDNTIFPKDFSFSNSKTINVQVVTDAPGVIEVYIPDADSTLLGTFGSRNFSHQFQIPAETELLALTYRDGQTFASAIFPVSDRQSIRWEPAISTQASLRVANTEGCTDRLYAVENSFGGFWEIDLSTGNYETRVLPDLTGGGSIACALDQQSGRVYYNVNQTMYAYDISSNSFEAVFNGNPYNGSYPRLAFQDGKFYMGNNTSMYIVDAATNEVLHNYTIEGIVNTAGGGDLAFTSNGDLYLSCFSGLYKFTELDSLTGIASVTRISAENFPYKLTSMAIDRKDDIYVGTNDAQSRLLRMNKEDGSFEIVKTYDHKINDLTAWRCADTDLAQTDTDQDGIIDALDDYPNDAEAAFDLFTPSEIGYGTLAFEDMWPMHGDYDFNDMVINYRFTNVLNSSNQSVRLEIELRLVAAGAGYRNGFGIQLPVNPSVITEVTGAQLTENYIQVDDKGLETGQKKAVIIPFDNALRMFNSGIMVNTRPAEGMVDPIVVNLTVAFNTPQEAYLFENAPYNPFLIIDGERGNELHLKNMLPTDLADLELFQSADDRSDIASGQTYCDDKNVPWAINLIHNFRYPVEKTRIDEGYNYFVAWGLSNGSLHNDWYKDNAGYRDDQRLVFMDY